MENKYLCTSCFFEFEDENDDLAFCPECDEESLIILQDTPELPVDLED
jgi:DNA-directed RNA polymerase subunit RPC12/RpoP